MSSGYAPIYGVVRRIPRGRVTTYGTVARLAGVPGHARLVGYALHALPDSSLLPWHRVVNARGFISLRREGAAREQAYRLEREGVDIGPGGRVDLRRFLWPSASGAPGREHDGLS